MYVNIQYTIANNMDWYCPLVDILTKAFNRKVRFVNSI